MPGGSFYEKQAATKKVAACDSDAIFAFKTPLGGQQELLLIGAEQTTGSLVVMILVYQIFGYISQQTE